MADTNTNGNRNPTASNQVNPPKLDPELKVLKVEDLPTETKLWKDIKKDILPVDFLLLTVRDFEFLGCLTFLEGLEKSYHKSLGVIYFGDIGDGEKKMKVAVMKSQMGASGVGAAVITVRNAVPILRPRAVFYVGICASLKKEKLKLGDVVVCRKLATYSSIKRTEKGIENRNVMVPIRKNLLNFINNITDGWKPPLENPASQDVKVCKEGVFLSGPEVVDDKHRRAELIELVNEAIAIECEGEGLFAAAYDLDIEWCVIKGVSDYADGKKSETDSWRQFASIMAASLVTHAVKDVNVFESWPHFEVKDDSVDEVRSTRSGSRKRRRSLSRSSSSDSKRDKWTPALPVKAGEPTKDELEALSLKIGDKWKELGLHLGFDSADLVAFDMDNGKLTKKAYGMLIAWKGKKGSNGTYLVLYDSLCHRFVGRKDLAEVFCCEKIAENGSN